MRISASAIPFQNQASQALPRFSGGDGKKLPEQSKHPLDAGIANLLANHQEQVKDSLLRQAKVDEVFSIRKAYAGSMDFFIQELQAFQRGQGKDSLELLQNRVQAQNPKFLLKMGQTVFEQGKEVLGRSFGKAEYDISRLMNEMNAGSLSILTKRGAEDTGKVYKNYFRAAEVIANRFDSFSEGDMSDVIIKGDTEAQRVYGLLALLTKAVKQMDDAFDLYPIIIEGIEYPFITRKA